MRGFLTLTFTIVVQGIAIVAAVTLALPAVFVGAGYLLSLLLPLSLFECSILSLGSTFMVILIYATRGSGLPADYYKDGEDKPEETSA